MRLFFNISFSFFTGYWCNENTIFRASWKHGPRCISVCFLSTIAELSIISYLYCCSKFLHWDTTRLIMFTCGCACIAQLLKSRWNIVVMNIFVCIKREKKHWNINSNTFCHFWKLWSNLIIKRSNPYLIFL